MLADKHIVHKLIPQEKPMIMVDQLLEHDEERTLTGFYVDADNLFVDQGYLTEAGLIENMAQSAALRTGWTGRQGTEKQDNFRPHVGVIGAVKDFRLYRMPEVHTHLQTEIEVIATFSNATMVKARVGLKDKIMAEAELKIFIQD